MYIRPYRRSSLVYTHTHCVISEGRLVCERKKIAGIIADDHLQFGIGVCSIAGRKVGGKYKRHRKYTFRGTISDFAFTLSLSRSLCVFVYDKCALLLLYLFYSLITIKWENVYFRPAP
jgi:hypothetical protein